MLFRKTSAIAIFHLLFFIQTMDITAQTIKELNDLSTLAWNNGDFQKAELYLHKMFLLKDSVSEENKIAIYNQLGIINKVIGKYDLALDYYKKAILISTKSIGANYSYKSFIHNNMAIVYRIKGDTEKALQFFNEALLNLSESKLPNKEKENESSKLYLNIGILYIQEMNYCQAINFLEKSKQLKLKFNLEGLENVYFNLAKAYENIQNNIEAEKYYLKSIIEWNKKKDVELYRSAPVYISYASLLSTINQKEKALNYFIKGQSIYVQNYGQRHPFTSKGYLALGNFYFKNNQLMKSLELYQKSLISNSIYFNDSSIFASPPLNEVFDNIQLLSNLKKKAETLLIYANNLSNKKTQIKYIEASVATLDLSIKLISNIRLDYLTNSSKLNITKDEKACYSMAVEASIKLFELTKNDKYKILAYSYVQKSKASLLHQEIMQNKAFISVLPDSIRHIKEESESNIFALKKLIFDESQKKNPNIEMIKKWSHSLFKLNNNYEELIVNIETKYIDYKHLIDKANLISLKNLQKNLKKDESIVEYSLSPKIEGKNRKLYIFTINNNSLNFCQNLTDSNFTQQIEYVRDQMNKKEGQIEGIAQYNEFNDKLFKLYKTLIYPVEKHLNGKVVFIVPDEEIAYLSFDALLKDYNHQSTINFAALHYLVYDYCFSYAYASNLLFQEVPNSSKSDYVYAFAPDYTGNNLTNTRFQFGKLENTENEIKGILHWFNGKALVGRAANESFFKTISGQGGIFHFAMHASSEKNNPDFSFLAITQKDSTEEDGFFYNYEIAMMNMKATMVVLSGCNTGDGIISSGEGIMSLTRNFILAGAPSIVHSLWEVQDETSVVIMDKFYEFLSQGMSKNEALHQAKLAYINQVTPTLVNPYFWSGYIHTGNPEPVVKNKLQIYSLSAVLLMIICVSFIGIRKYKKSRNKSKLFQ